LAEKLKQEGLDEEKIREALEERKSKSMQKYGNRSKVA
jgi:hypothetical protein